MFSNIGLGVVVAMQKEKAVKSAVKLVLQRDKTQN